MKQSINQAVLLGALATNSRVALSAESGSPLEVMVRAISAVRPNFDYIANNVTSEQEQLEQVAGLIHSPITTDDVSDAVSGDLIKNIALKVSSHVDYARNVIVPALKNYVANVCAYMETPEQFSNRFEIIIDEAPAIVNELGFKAMVADESGGIYADPETYVKIPTPSSDAILKYCLIGESSYDELITKWLTSLPNEWLVSAWEHLFGNENKKLTELFEDYKNGLNYALFTYLVTRRISDDIPEGIVMPLNNYKRFIAQYKDAAAVSISSHCKRQETLDKAGILITNANTKNYVVYVNGNVYKQYIANGGKNEVIFGSLLSGRVAKTVSVMQESAEEYLKLYEQYEGVNAARQRLNAVNKLRTALKVEFVNLLNKNELDPLEQEAFANFNYTVEKLATKADEVIETITNDDVGNIHEACLKVLCRARYEYTDAEKFLKAMNEAAKANPNIDAREAALPALIELVTGYVIAQITKRNT